MYSTQPVGLFGDFRRLPAVAGGVGRRPAKNASRSALAIRQRALPVPGCSLTSAAGNSPARIHASTLDCLHRSNTVTSVAVKNSGAGLFIAWPLRFLRSGGAISQHSLDGVSVEQVATIGSNGWDSSGFGFPPKPANADPQNAG